MPGQNLTRDEARTRAALTVDSYEIALDLTTGPTTFRSTTVVRFGAPEGFATFIDLIAPTVHEVVLNGRSLDPAVVFADSRIALDGLAEHNELRVVADCAYMNTGEGLHRFVDPVDDEVYLYSQFEVADSRRVFAVFEQPDLKATFTFTVVAPSHWTVVSNSPTPSPEPVADAASRWSFAPTPRLASYVTAIVAGPYHRVEGAVTSAKGEVPAAVLCRASLGEHLDAEEILAITQAGFTFYEERFGLPYPFAKYDQIFVPEFNAGAMENAGAVTFLEAYVFRSKVPDAMVERRDRDDPARARAHVVRRPGHHALVGRPVAQRVVRGVRLPPRHRRGDPVDVGVDHVLLAGEVLGLPAGPAAVDPPDRRRHPRPGGRRGQLRRDHLRQGRLGAQAAGRLGRRGAVLRRRARVLRRARVGQHRAARPARRARGDQRPRPVGVVEGVARAGRGHAAAPGGRGRRARRRHPRRGRTRRCRRRTPCSARTASWSPGTTWCPTATARA